MPPKTCWRRSKADGWRHFGRHRPGAGMSRSGFAVGGRVRGPRDRCRLMPAKTRGQWPRGCGLCFPRSHAKPKRASSGQRSAIAAGGAAAGMGWPAGSNPDAREVSSWMRERPAGLFAVSYEPHAGCFFDGDDPLQLMRQVPDLLAFHIEAREPWPPARRPRSVCLQSSTAMPIGGRSRRACKHFPPRAGSGAHRRRSLGGVAAGASGCKAMEIRPVWSGPSSKSR